jgi:hypothetical protein
MVTGEKVWEGWRVIGKWSERREVWRKKAGTVEDNRTRIIGGGKSVGWLRGLKEKRLGVIIERMGR